MNLRVLLIGTAPEDLLFVQDVLREIEQERLLPEWPRIETTFAATYAEAERILTTSPPHAILLDLARSDETQRQVSPQSGIFQVTRSRAPDVPVILLLEAGGEAQGVHLMREGAQDFLLKPQMDCAPLAHSLRNAVLRHRLLAAARAGAHLDALTGLANRPAFLAIAERDRKLAERLERRWMLLIAEPRHLAAVAAAFGEQRRDLDLVEAAEQLRAMISPADLLARLDDRRFVISIFDADAETVEEAWARIRGAAAEARMDVGVAIFDPSRSLTLDAMLERALSDLPARQEPVHPPQRAGAA